MKYLLYRFIPVYLLFPVILWSQAGALDTQFGDDGIVRMSLGSSNNVMEAMVLQEDGKIIMAGHVMTKATLARFCQDGSLDTSFGEEGKVFSDFGFDYNQVHDIVLQEDGKIIAAIRVNDHYSNDPDAIVAKYHPNGALDTSFGQNGYITVSTGFTSEHSTKIRLQEDGKIILAVNIGNYKVVLARLYNNGVLDTSFGTEGFQIVSFGEEGIPSRLQSLEIQKNGKILVGGQTPVLSLPPYGKHALARLKLDGSLDSIFGNNGVIITPLIGLNIDLEIQSDQKIVSLAKNSQDTIALLRFNIDGSLDTEFGENGITIISIDNRVIEGRSVCLQADGKILIGGYIDEGMLSFTSNFLLLRYTAHGILDTTFGNNGIVETEISEGEDRMEKVLFRPNGKILAGGEVFVVEYVLTQYLSELNVGTVDFSVANSALIYPNPILQNANFRYTLLHSHELSLQLFDNQGKLVQSFFTSERKEKGAHLEYLDFSSHISPGIYILVLSNRKENINIIIVKQ